jgi:hypothetical protein
MRLDLPTSNYQDIAQALKSQGFCLVSANTLSQVTQVAMKELLAFNASWASLAHDQFLKDLGKYRLRCHSSYVIEKNQVRLFPHRAHWQSIDYNALHGGLLRMFEPIDSSLNHSATWMQLIAGVASIFNGVSASDTWFTEAHQFRINTLGGIGRPTPEGAHRDGVDYVAVILVARHNIKGGETRIFKMDGNEGLRFTLSEPWSMLLIDDRRIIHETTPIQDDGGDGYRDTLVLTFRSDGFQEPVKRP